MTIYLKFPDEAAAIAVLAQFRIADEAGVEQWQLASHTHALDVVGVIYKPTGVMIPSADPNFPDTPEMAPIPGSHVNFIGALPEAALPYVVTPSTPSRVFG